MPFGVCRRILPTTFSTGICRIRNNSDTANTSSRIGRVSIGKIVTCKSCYYCSVISCGVFQKRQCHVADACRRIVLLAYRNRAGNRRGIKRCCSTCITTALDVVAVVECDGVVARSRWRGVGSVLKADRFQDCVDLGYCCRAVEGDDKVRTA